MTGENLRLMLVEDDPEVAKCCMRQFEELGFEFRVTLTHAEAIALLEEDNLVNVVLLDHGVTDAPVAEFVSAARSIRDDIEIIGCSANDCRKEFEAVGVWKFLRKPFDLSELEEILGPRLSQQHASDTQIGDAGTDTSFLRFAYGERVSITDGSLNGIEGTFISVRSGGKILVKLENGIFLEAFQYRFKKNSA